MGLAINNVPSLPGKVKSVSRSLLDFTLTERVYHFLSEEKLKEIERKISLLTWKMTSRLLIVFIVVVFALCSSSQADATKQLHDRNFKLSSPFPSALETLQKQIGYTFHNIDLLRRAMTHSSFSEENYRTLSILGTSIIETSVCRRYLGKDIDISAKELNNRILDISKIDSSCAVDAMRLGLQKIVRVSSKTNSSTPTVVCGAFRAIFGAVAIDTENSDDAGSVFWSVHGNDFGRALAL